MLDEQRHETARFLCFLLSLYQRVADGEDVPAGWLDVLVNLDPALIEFLAAFVAARNARAKAAMAKGAVDMLVEGTSTTSKQPQPSPNIIPFPRPGREREPASATSLAPKELIT